jgi:hypothetical protein
MSNTAIVTIYLDAARPGGQTCRCVADQDSALDADRLQLLALDQFVLRVFWRDFVTTATGADWTWNLGSIAASLAAETAVSGQTGVELARVTGFTIYKVGDYYCYYATVDLDDQAIDNAIGTSAAYIDCYFDIRVTDSAGNVLSYRVGVQLNRSAYATVSTLGAAAGSMANTSNAQIRQVADGKFQFYDHGRAQWFEPKLENGALSWHPAP